MKKQARSKIAIVCQYELLSDRVGGMDYFFWKFDKECKENDIDVDWFFPNEADFGEYKNLDIISCNYQAVEKFFLNYLQKNSNKRYDCHIFHFTELFSKTLKIIKNIDPSVKQIAIDHNPRPIDGYSIKKIIKKKINGFINRNSLDIIISVSKKSQMDFLNEFGFFHKNKNHLILNGITIRNNVIKNKGVFSGKFIVACNLRKEKGIQDLLYALQPLKNLNFTIDIYGKGNFENHLHNLRNILGLEKIVFFKGSTNNVLQKYVNYDYLLHPSHSETYCYSVVEALSVGLPVITTKKHGNILGLIKNTKNGFLFESKNINQLSNILFDLSKNKEQIFISKSDIKQLRNTLSTKKMVDEHLKVLKNIF